MGAINGILMGVYAVVLTTYLCSYKGEIVLKEKKGSH